MSHISFLGLQRSHHIFEDDPEIFSNIRSHTAQPLCYSPICQPIQFERSVPMSSAPEMNFRRNHSNRLDYVKSWSLDAARCVPSLLPNEHRHSLLGSSRVRRHHYPYMFFIFPIEYYSEFMNDVISGISIQFTVKNGAHLHVRFYLFCVPLV